MVNNATSRKLRTPISSSMSRATSMSLANGCV